MAICWQTAVVLALLSAYVVLLYAVLIICVPFPLGVWSRMWNSIISVPAQAFTSPFKTLNFNDKLHLCICLLCLLIH